MANEGQVRGRSPARAISPKRAITPKRATQLQLEIAAKQAELASLLEATGQEDGTVEPGMNKIVLLKHHTNDLPYSGQESQG